MSDESIGEYLIRQLREHGVRHVFGVPGDYVLGCKSVISERHPLYLGVYEGGMGREETRDCVESSDCLLFLGAPLTDMDLGIYTARLDPARTIHVVSEKVGIRRHTFEDVRMDHFIRGLLAEDLPCRDPGPLPHPAALTPFVPVPDRRITVRRLFERLNAFIADDTVVIADPGDALFAGADLFIHNSAEFLSPAYYTSLGFAVPAALGAQLANPERRPLVLVGDGAFQMTGMELSTLVRFGLNPIVVVLDNGGYGTERPMLDGSFNDLKRWNYSRIPDVLGEGHGFEVRTEGDLDAALEAAARDPRTFSVLDVKLEVGDHSPALARLTAALRRRM